MLIKSEVSAETGFHSGALVTLENVISPGRRSRLSPYVEAAQFEVLFGEAPNEGARVASAKRILESHKERVHQIASSWRAFQKEGKPFSETKHYHNANFLDAYLAYYFSVNVPKVQLTLLELLRAGRLAGSINLLDIGVGTGTTAIAILDFLLALGSACDLHGIPFPVSALHLHGVDRSAQCIGYSKLVVLAYARALERRIEARARMTNAARGTDDGDDILHRVHAWALSADWDLHDFNMPTPDFSPSPNLVVVSNTLNELREESAEALGHLESFLKRRTDKSLAVIIEPGEPEKAIGLMAWRRSFVNCASGYESLGPCGQEFGSTLPRACEQCWLLRRERFHQGPLYVAFREAVASARTFNYDEHEERLLRWSYTLLERTQESTNSSAVLPLQPGDVVNEPITLRYIGTYSGAREPAHRDLNGLEAIERVKFCPARANATKLEFLRPPYTEMPWLRFGQLCEARNLRVTSSGIGGNLELHGDAESLFESVENEATLASYIKRTYDEYSQRAVNEFAYRLFGFPQMHDFQHVIIGEVLQGNSILGIAATGGGKSECYILPAILMPGVTLVVSPLKALMADQFEQRIRERYGLDSISTFINGDVGFPERNKRLSRLERGHYKLVYLTPEQLERDWILASLERTRAQVGITYLAMDEAHCISQWGHDFRPAYLNVYRRLMRNGLGLEPTRIALTATASPFVRKDICGELELAEGNYPDGQVFVHSSNRPELNLVVRTVSGAEQKARHIASELEALQQRNSEHCHAGEEPEAAIVFMPWAGKRSEVEPNGTDRRVMPFAAFLQSELGERVAVYHSKMEDDNRPSDAPCQTNSLLMDGRTRACEQKSFIEDDCTIMVATKGFGMGIDKANVRRVIHHTLPGNLESYAQEAGRAGRDGQISNAVLYYSPPSVGAQDTKGRSDKGVQDWFRESKYIRREDALLMLAFLKLMFSNSVHPEGWSYFTNDEVLAFVERCEDDPSLADLDVPYLWPEQLRAEHYFGPKVEFDPTRKKHLFDKGKMYRERTDYVDRILQSMYTIRPALDPVLLLQLHKTGTLLEQVAFCDAQAIWNSNFYFGPKLKQALSHPKDLRALFMAGDLEALAQRLSQASGEYVTMHSVGALAYDIMAAKGSPDAGLEYPALLRFGSITTPLRGVSFSREDHDSWVRHAGAKRSGNASRTQAHERARRAMDLGYSRELYQPEKSASVVPKPLVTD